VPEWAFVALGSNLGDRDALLRESEHHIGALADTEIVAGWRLRMILSTNGTPIQGFDQDSWASTFNYGRQDSRKSLETFRVLREYNLTMLKSAPKPLWENYGMHTERGRESAKHILRLFAGHDVNHLLQIEGIVKDGKKKK